MTLQTITFSIVCALLLAGCGTIKDKTAPCKRPAEMTSFADETSGSCGPMRAINNPATVFSAIGIVDPSGE